MIEINAEELLNRIYDECLPGDPPHHREPTYVLAIADVEAIIRKMMKEWEARMDLMAEDLTQNAENRRH